MLRQRDNEVWRNFWKKKEDNPKEYLREWEIWYYYDGYEEDYINTNIEIKCLNCNKKEDSFLKFVQGYETDIKIDVIEKINIKIDDTDKTNIKIDGSDKINLKNDDIGDNNPISLMFSTTDNATISRSIVCYPKEKFSDAVNRIYEEYPQHKNKPKVYTSNGDKIEENKTIEQNKFKDGDKILILFTEEEPDTPKLDPKVEPLIE